MSNSNQLLLLDDDEVEQKTATPVVMLPRYSYQDSSIKYEAGIDEAGRGCLSGRVYTACVILPDTFPDNKYLDIKDSKKISKKKRETMRKYIEDNAICYNVTYADVSEIDNKNILHATLASMHRAVAGMSIKPELLAVDGNSFNLYFDENDEIISHILITGGDNKYRNIAAASILAKTYHDEYVNKLCDENPDYEKYGWRKNMCYGTKAHIDAIKLYGITPLHRKTFGICKEY
jgi:ribonuclease HII